MCDNCATVNDGVTTQQDIQEYHFRGHIKKVYVYVDFKISTSAAQCITRLVSLHVVIENAWSS